MGEISCLRFPGCPNQVSSSSNERTFVAFIQPIHYFDPSQYKVLKCYKGASSRLRMKLLMKSALKNDANVNRAEILDRLSRHIRRMKRMLDAEPCLWNDFQFMLMLDGSIVHLDFDRCAVEEGKVASKPCPSTLDLLVDRVRKAMDKAKQELLAEATGNTTDT